MPRKVLMVSQDVDGCIFSTDDDSNPHELVYRNHNLIVFIADKAREIKATHVVFVNGSARQTKRIDDLNMNSDPENKSLPVFAGIDIIRAAVARILFDLEVSLCQVTLADALLETEVGRGFSQANYVLPGAYQRLKYPQVYLAAHHLAKQHIEQDPATEFVIMHVDDRLPILEDLARRAAAFPRGRFFGVSYPQYEGENLVSRNLMLCEQQCFGLVDHAPFQTIRAAINQELEEEAQAAQVLSSLAFRP